MKLSSKLALLIVLSMQIQTLNAAVENCLFPDSSGGCFLCNFSYRPSAGKCFKSIFLCLGYDTGVATCNSCFLGFHLASDNLSCFPDILFCATYVPSTTAPSVCATCVTSYQIDANGTQCVRTITNCAAYNPFGLGCQTCKTGYRPSLFGIACDETV